MERSSSSPPCGMMAALHTVYSTALIHDWHPHFKRCPLHLLSKLIVFQKKMLVPQPFCWEVDNIENYFLVIKV